VRSRERFSLPLSNVITLLSNVIFPSCKLEILLSLLVAIELLLLLLLLLFNIKELLSNSSSLNL